MPHRNGKHHSPANGQTYFQSLRRWSAFFYLSHCQATLRCQMRKKRKAKSGQSRETQILRRHLASHQSQSLGSQALTQRSSPTFQAFQSRCWKLEAVAAAGWFFLQCLSAVQFCYLWIHGPCSTAVHAYTAAVFCSRVSQWSVYVSGKLAVLMTSQQSLPAGLILVGWYKPCHGVMQLQLQGN